MANEKEYIPEGTATSGNRKDGDDLSEKSKDTLGKYLADQTKVNHYSIDPSLPRVEVSLKGSNNRPSEFKTGGESSDVTFTRSLPTSQGGSGLAGSNFETLSNSGMISSDINPVIDKNGSGDGHHLLTGVVSNKSPTEIGIGDTSGATALKDPDNAAPVQKKISAMLVNGNRFDPTPGSSPYIEDGKFTDPGIPIQQGSFGVYDGSSARTTIEELQNVAKSLLVRQTGERTGEGDSPDGGESVTPSAVQRGSDLLDVSKTRAVNAFAAPSRPTVANAELRYNDIDGKALKSQKSYGALSSYREDFQNSPISNSLTAAGAFGEYLLGALVFTAIFTLIERLQRRAGNAVPNSPASLKKGQSNLSGPTLLLLERLGVPTLTRPAWLCAIYGIAAFFRLPASALPSPDGKGIPTLPSIPPTGGGDGTAKVSGWFTSLVLSGELTKIFSNMIFGAGYYANLTRVVRRDLDVLLEDLGASITGGADEASLFQLLTSLNRYNSWTFYTTLLRMGEVWLNSYDPNMQFDNTPINGQTKAMLSRGNPARNELAWRHRSAPALMLLNDKYVNAMKAFGFHSNQAQLLHNKIGDEFSRSQKDNPYYDKVGEGRKGQSRGTYGLKSNPKSRLTREQVIEVENELDAEYCPFYFHDLRTNEVIGFQAFLSDVKDSYSVSYAESTGYGRIDPVKIYKETTRSINVSWTMVATSPDDFDSMWYSINKMVSMIYPQFSMGKPVRAGDKKFVMPFSQIPTATPVVRLRVGDVIRSNYSRFNLARLFGLSEIKPAAKGVSADAISNAPFDLSATAAVESAKAKKEKEEKDRYAALDAEIGERFGKLPLGPGDDKHGFVPGDPNWGKAILLPSSAGYLTYDTNTPKVINLGGSDFASVKNNYDSNKPADGATKVESSYFTSKPATEGEVVILERVMAPVPQILALPFGGGDLPGSVPMYLVTYKDRDDAADPYAKVSKKGHHHVYAVYTNDLKYIKPAIEVPPGEPVDPTISFDKQVADIHSFFDPDNNAIVRSFEAAGGRGLAGVITSFDMDWAEAQWDMSGIGRRAPTMVKCSIAFSPIHDIIPGLDNNGMPRAMNYPVGNIAGPMGTDFYDPGGIPAETPGSPASNKLGDASLENYSNFKKTKKTGGEGGSG